MNNSFVVVLGFFGSFHKGHVSLINSGKRIAEETNSKLAVFTFDDDFYECLNIKSKYIYTIDERHKIAKSLGVDKFHVLNSHTTLKLTADEFIDKVIGEYSVQTIIAGEDYRLGCDKKDVYYLKEKLMLKNVDLIIVSIEKFNNQKISTTNISQLISAGEVDKASMLLGKYYSITGNVIDGMKEGRKYKINTANININKIKLLPANGVYFTLVEINNQIYRAVTHVGPKPTYKINGICIETHIIEFYQDIYTKDIKIYFVQRIRDIIEFDIKSDLYDQILSDINVAKSLEYNPNEL